MGTITRGDTATATLTLTDTDTDGALNLSGKRITVTCRKGPDKDVLYEHYIEVDGGGVVTASSGMALQSTAAAGIIVETITSTESETFKAGSYKYDLEVRAAGTPDIVATPILGAAETVVADYTLPPE
jgi:hypothetical protein